MHLPAATIRTQVMLPLRFADGFGTTARVYTFDGLADGREHLALGLAGGGGICGSGGPAAGPDPQRVLHRRRPRARAVRVRAAAAGGGPAHRAGRGLPLYRRQDGRGIGLYAKLDAYGLQDAALDTYDANLALGYSEDGRDYTVAAQMLGGTGKWQQGFGLLTVEGQHVKPETVPIAQGRFTVGGRTWEV